MMQTSLVINVLDILLCISFLFIAIRAFYLYMQICHARLFVLGLSMVVIALTVAVDIVSGMVGVTSFNTEYFCYCGQAMSFLFIFLSILFESEKKLFWLVRWQIIVSLLLLESLVMSPLVPEALDLVIQILLSSSRSIICFVIFFFYLRLFVQKHTRFSMLMALSFMLLSFGYALTLPMHIFPDQNILDCVGDTVCIFGVVVMIACFVIG